MKKQKVYLDMDGTIADLYGQQNWLQKIHAETVGLFSSCNAFITESELLSLFPQDNYEIAILSMTPKNASKEYCAQVIKEKNEWLDKNFPSIIKRIFKPYGYNKNLKNSKNAILIDDNETIRNNFKGLAYSPMWL